MWNPKKDVDLLVLTEKLSKFPKRQKTPHRFPSLPRGVKYFWDLNKKRKLCKFTDVSYAGRLCWPRYRNTGVQTEPMSSYSRMLIQQFETSMSIWKIAGNGIISVDYSRPKITALSLKINSLALIGTHFWKMQNLQGRPWWVLVVQNIGAGITMPAYNVISANKALF